MVKDNAPKNENEDCEFKFYIIFINKLTDMLGR